MNYMSGPPVPGNVATPQGSSEEQELVGRLIREFQYLFGLRGNWNSHWTEIAQRILPMESWLFQNFSQLTQQGDKRNFEVYDSTGVLALQRFGAIMDSLLTPQNQVWHYIHPDDPILLRDKGTRLWFEEVNKILFRERYAPGANFTSQNQKVYTSLGAYGTGSLLVDRLQGKKGIRYRHVHLGEIYLQENHQGVVDRLCRHFMMTARQAYQRFGERCPETIKSVYKMYPDRQFKFIHWCIPNEDRMPDRRDFKGMEYSSYYIAIEGNALCEQGGYRSFPYATSRYFQAANEAYGRSIAMDVLPALKTLNEQKKAMLKQAHRILDPVLLVHDDGVIDGFSLQPGALNFGGITNDGRALVQPLPTGNIQVGKDSMNDERQIINDSFLISLFQILTENPQMTATEVAERVREKGILLAPTIGRQESEYKGPLIERELELLDQQDMIPPLPRMLASFVQSKVKDGAIGWADMHGIYKHVHDSPISKIMRAEATAGTMRTFESLGQIAQQIQDPSVLDYIDVGKAALEIARSNSVPESSLRSEQEVAKIKQARAKQMQAQQNIQAAPAAAGMMKAMKQ